MRTIFILLFILSFAYAPLSYSTNNSNENTEEKILTQSDLLSEQVFYNKKITFSGSFKKRAWKNLDKKIPNVKDLSLEFVNQPTFRTEESRQGFLKALSNLSKLENLSLENQFFTDDHLGMIPKWIQTLNLSKTSVLGYGPKNLSNKNIKIIGI